MRRAAKAEDADHNLLTPPRSLLDLKCGAKHPVNDRLPPQMSFGGTQLSEAYEAIDRGNDLVRRPACPERKQRECLGVVDAKHTARALEAALKAPLPEPRVLRCVADRAAVPALHPQLAHGHSSKHTLEVFERCYVHGQLCEATIGSNRVDGPQPKGDALP